MRWALSACPPTVRTRDDGRAGLHRIGRAGTRSPEPMVSAVGLIPRRFHPSSVSSLVGFIPRRFDPPHVVQRADRSRRPVFPGFHPGAPDRSSAEESRRNRAGLYVKENRPASGSISPRLYRRSTRDPAPHCRLRLTVSLGYGFASPPRGAGVDADLWVTSRGPLEPRGPVRQRVQARLRGPVQRLWISVGSCGVQPQHPRVRLDSVRRCSLHLSPNPS